MDNVPVHANRTTAVHANEPTGHKRKQKRNIKPIAIALSLTLAAGILVVIFLSLYRSSTSANIDAAKYQAVFFTNGQVYFGKLQTLNGGYMRLSDVFYLEANATSQDSKNPQETADETTSDLKLVKLGQEVHGPEDEMIINEEQILFFENLKDDGTVSQSIRTFKAQ